MSEMEIRDRIEKEKQELEKFLHAVEKDLAFRKGKIQALEELLAPPPEPEKAVGEALQEPAPATL